MQFIEELTLIHKAAIGGAVVLIALFAVVAKRRRAGTAAATDSPAKQPRGRKRAKDDSLPRRKRRKLAAEAAHLGLEAPAVDEIHIPAVPEVPAMPEPIAEGLFADEVPAPTVAAVAPAPVIEDPYVHGAPLNINIESDVVVAQPGWPAPGELVTSFDPDAFDPVPELYGPLSDDELYEADREDATATVQVDDTAALDLAPLSTSDEAAALNAIEEWADTVEDDEWNVAVNDDTSSGAWSIADSPAPADAVAASDDEGDNLEDLWSEPDDEPLWTAEPEAQEASVEIVPEAVEEDDSEVNAWPEGVAESWSPEETVVATAPEVTEAIALDAWNGQIGSPNSPVVLDLAGLAASGQALELVIEPNADGHGVRLRFGAPAASAASIADVVVTDEAAPMPNPDEFGVSFDEVLALETEDVAVAIDDHEVAADPVADEATTPAEASTDVPFLAGIAPSSVDEPVAEAPARVETPTEDSRWDDSADAPMMVVEDAQSFGDHDGPVDGEMEFAHEAPTTATAVMDDDPARILADIRARLAALDAHR